MSKRTTMSERLSKALGEKWRAVRDEGDWSWHWVNETGRTVRSYSESVLGYDGYSDTDFRTVYIDDTGKQVGSTWPGTQPTIYGD